MEFTTEEKRQIRKSLKTIVKDMRELWKIYPHQEVDIEVSLPNVNLSDYGCFWRLLMDKDKIILYSSSSKNYSNLERHRIHHLQDLCYTKGDYLAHFGVVSQYDQIRNRIEEIVKERYNRQQQNIDKLSDIEQRHSKKTKQEKEKLAATVQIDLPPTQNLHEIEISEENGKKVGRIDFGAQTIKIITEGDIVLVNKTENSKVKRR